MNFLGVDYGTVRVGLAVGDERDQMALPLETAPAAQAVARIRALVAERGIGRIVLGMPRNMNGTYGPRAEEARKFGAVLTQAVGVEVVFWDERLTSRSVERMLVEADVSRKRRREVTDQLAAQQILQNYLDAQEARRAPPDLEPD